MNKSLIEKKLHRIITERVGPRFPIKAWNFHERVKKGLPTTNNGVEVWHNSRSADKRAN